VSNIKSIGQGVRGTQNRGFPIDFDCRILTCCDHQPVFSISSH